MAKGIVLRSPSGEIVVYEIKKVPKDEMIKKFEERNFDYLKTVTMPSMKKLEEWVCDSVVKAVDGCDVESDWTCQHEYPSWLLVLGII
jgi:hypothetical protein